MNRSWRGSVDNARPYGTDYINKKGDERNPGDLKKLTWAYPVAYSIKKSYGVCRSAPYTFTFPYPKYASLPLAPRSTAVVSSIFLT